MRLRKLKHASERLEKHPDFVILNPLDYKGKWNQLFAKKQPIHLEIGMGKGKFIIAMAKQNPHINFIGMEREDSVLVKAVEKEENPLPNLVYILGDAKDSLSLFEKEEVAMIYLNFSDPWPKNRHTKRRLTSDNLLMSYQSILQKNGIIEMKTDNRKLFEFSVLQFIEQGFQVMEWSLHLHEDRQDVITTEYEERFLQENKTIYYVKVKNGTNEII
ncbi:MAG: tRNA (guanosine(46)-N7)-methyltransferase TrmB [Bacilli bacterium]|jgi:tRNA (guanine-N7-)-methyltransferase|nr:tRNA (guanosine(46)-N7)-methyltransferase TrmB [Bacilli bacterium]MDY0064226.1 tRNA (guanosine(46)-N7)-methyltransferase TrmB [Bacilli bacterium]